MIDKSIYRHLLPPFSRVIGYEPGSTLRTILQYFHLHLLFYLQSSLFSNKSNSLALFNHTMMADSAALTRDKRETIAI